MIRAIIYDLDNTIFPVPAIGNVLFGPVFDLIAQTGQHNHDMEAIKYAIMRTPFRLVAQRHGFSQELTQAGINLQETLEYHQPIAPFEDYPLTHSLPGERFLVTTGFDKMQRSKIRQLGIEGEFKEIHVVNPTLSSKKEVFAGILERYGYAPNEVLVIGDDPESEIAAAKALNIATVLYDPAGNFSPNEATYHIKHYSQLAAIVQGLG
ncbi:haloacid dehalogenase [Flavobacterium akiainvivens]|uniref:Haloacid dehalogenase n=1 Tax=Flavobacterium akiainvivens TaxID=1202724 RepID=A0A0M8MAT4_9FLAO|nr:HAD family hydrolase [Flavobacterium akiainvivens]KOS06195.1 haloacid dehalogenase [Flavobacterium akiainvivens]SFQ68450.1 putative hydrolase of the HAD superfamily [Flavobacterium akiainvivens]